MKTVCDDLIEADLFNHLILILLVIIAILDSKKDIFIQVSPQPPTVYVNEPHKGNRVSAKSRTYERRTPRQIGLSSKKCPDLRLYLRLYLYYTCARSDALLT